MAPLAGSNTFRVKTYYRCFGEEHVVMTRYARGTNPSSMMTSLNPAFWEGLMDIWRVEAVAEDWQFLRCEYAEPDSDVFNPHPSVPATPVGFDYPVATATSLQKASYIKFSGRGNGRNYNFELFGVYYSTQLQADAASDGIITAAEDGYVASVFTHLGLSGLVTISGGVVVWTGKANYKVSDYWRDQYKG